jgi:hemoglobin
VNDEGIGADKPSFYERVGGEPTFRALVHRFYAGVATDPLLRPLYPEEDLGPAEDRLAMFLVQYWGGPSTYSEQDALAKDRWLHHMRAAVDEAALAPAERAELWGYLERAAQFMVNA